MASITIIGAGFAALSAVEAIRKRDKGIEIVVVGARPEFIYLPSLIWLPSSIRRPDDLRIPLDRFFTRHQVKFHQGEASGLADGGRRVITTTGEIANDGLIIACGGRFIKKLPGIEHAITPCEGIAPCMDFGEKLKRLEGGTIAFGFSGNPNEPSAMRGGPIFEFLFGVDRQLKREGRRDKFKLVFFSPAAKPGQRLGEKVVPRLLLEMQKRGIKTHLGHKLKGFAPGKIMTEGGDMDADLVMFMPGLTGNAWFEGSGLPLSPGGLIRADGLCRVEGMERVYVAGDAGSFPGPDWMPKQAHMADLQARAAAANLLAELAGREPSETFRVELVCIIDEGRNGAMVARNPSMVIMLPFAPVWHWAKRWFEGWYLRRFR